jgi:small subunit ribosomal protein S20
MPIIKAAKKDLRKSARRHKLNTKRRRVLKDTTKEVRLLVAAKKTTEAQAILSQAYQAIDKAAKRGIINKGAAARKKSRLTKLINRSAK